jgi:hypothetical protein
MKNINKIRLNKQGKAEEGNKQREWRGRKEMKNQDRRKEREKGERGRNDLRNKERKQETNENKQIRI